MSNQKHALKTHSSRVSDLGKKNSAPRFLLSFYLPVACA
jgi:hypothetical protein